MRPPAAPTSCARDVADVFHCRCADPARPGTLPVPTQQLTHHIIIIINPPSLHSLFLSLPRPLARALAHSRASLALPLPLTSPSSSSSLPRFLSLSVSVFHLVSRAGSSRESCLAPSQDTLLPPPSSVARPYVFPKTDGDFVTRIRGRHVGSLEIRQQKHGAPRQVPVLNKCRTRIRSRDTVNVLAVRD